MSLLSRYVFRQLLVGMLAVSAGLACALWLSNSLHYIDLIVNKGLSLATFFKLAALLLPNVLVFILPIALFTVVLFTFNKLSVDRELVVMRAAGLGPWQLARPALLLALAATILAYALTVYINPLSVRIFREMRWEIYNELSGIVIREGLFNEVANELTIYIRERDSDGTVHGILVHDKRNPERPVTMWAERGSIVQHPGGPHVLMEQGTRQEIVRGTGQLSVLEFDRYSLDLNLTPPPGGKRWRGNPREWTMTELFSATPEGVGAETYLDAQVETHQRLTLPLYNLALALAAMATLFSGGFSRRGQTGRILLAIAIGIVVQGAALGSASLTLDNLQRWPLMYAAPGFFILIAGMVLGGWLRLPSRPRPAEGTA